MKKIAIVGALWTPNFGDVLLAKLLKEQLESLGCQVSLLNSHDKIKQELMLTERVERISDYDCLFFCGGGYFSEPPGNSYKWALSRYKLLFKYSTLCKLNKIPYYIVGVGAGPIKSFLAKAVIKHVCSGAKVIALRDKESIEAIASLAPKSNLIEVADYVLSMKDKLSLKIIDTGVFKIGVHITVNGKKNIPAILKYLENTRKLSTKQVYFIEDHPGEFERLSLIYPDIKIIFGQNVMSYVSVDRFIHDMNELDYVITSKLHVGIVAAVLEKKICSLPYHAKVERLYQSLKREDLCLTDLSCDDNIIDHLKACEASENVEVPMDIKNKSRKIDTLITEIITHDKK